MALIGTRKSTIIRRTGRAILLHRSPEAIVKDSAAVREPEDRYAVLIARNGQDHVCECRGFAAHAPPADGRQRLGEGAVEGRRRRGQSSALLVPSPQVEKNEGGAPGQADETGGEQHVLDEQH